MGLCWRYGDDAPIWDAAIAVSPDDSKLDQAERFPICQPEPLEALFTDTGLKAVWSRSIEVPTVFKNFDDYWIPFLGKHGSAPTYLASVNEEIREKIRARLQARLLPSMDGTIHCGQEHGPCRELCHHNRNGRPLWIEIKSQSKRGRPKQNSHVNF